MEMAQVQQNPKIMGTSLQVVFCEFLSINLHNGLLVTTLTSSATPHMQLLLSLIQILRVSGLMVVVHLRKPTIYKINTPYVNNVKVKQQRDMLYINSLFFVRYTDSKFEYNNNNSNQGVQFTNHLYIGFFAHFPISSYFYLPFPL